MSVEPPSIRSLLETTVVIRPIVRILLAVVVVAGGLAFVAIGAAFLFRTPPVPYPHPVGAAVFSVVISALGAGFVWVGLRLMRARIGTENLLSPIARRRCSLIVGGLSVGMVAAAFDARNVWFLSTAAGLVVFSYWLFPLERR